MIIALFVIIYFVLGTIIGRVIYNITLLSAYEANLSALNKKTDWSKNWHISFHKKETLEEVALQEVFSYTMTRESAVFFGILWPVTGLWYMLYLLSRKSNIRIMPKNSVEKQIELKKIKAESDKKYQEAIKILESAGFKAENIHIK